MFVILFTESPPSSPPDEAEEAADVPRSVSAASRIGLIQPSDGGSGKYAGQRQHKEVFPAFFECSFHEVSLENKKSVTKSAVFRQNPSSRFRAKKQTVNFFTPPDSLRNFYSRGVKRVFRKSIRKVCTIAKIDIRETKISISIILRFRTFQRKNGIACPFPEGKTLSKRGSPEPLYIMEYKQVSLFYNKSTDFASVRPCHA